MKNQNEINKIAVFGPHDRFNYGDFLFPLVIDYCFSLFSEKKVVLCKYSLIDVNYEYKGAFKSKGYKSLKKNIKNGLHDKIIVSGGECLPATWARLYSYLNPNYNKFYQEYKSNRIFRNFPKYYLGGKSEYPYAININDFQTNIKIFYNAVGGGWNINSNIINRLKCTNIIGVRDEKSYNNLNDNHIISDLVPDSAVMLSKLYPIESLNNISIEDEYLFFQVSNYLINDYEIEKVCRILEEILKIFNLKIVFCPIGTASGHEDHIPLKKMHNYFKSSSIYIDDPSIEDILTYIANSKLYIGTSLHGVITAMNYGVPYIGIDKVIKQKEYIKTWSIPYLKDSFSNFTNLKYVITKVMNLDSLSNQILNKNILNQNIYLHFIRKIYDESVGNNSNL